MVAKKRELARAEYLIYKDQKEEIQRIAEKRSKQEKRKVTTSEVVRNILI